MRIQVASFLVALGLSSCTVAPPPLPGAPQSGVRCINNHHVAGRRGAGPNAVDFEMSNGAVFRNHFRHQCPGIDRLGSTLAIAVVSGGEGGHLCSGDRVRLFDPIEARATGLAAQPSCVLGEFVQVPR